MGSPEIISEAIKAALALITAGVAGYVIALWRKPSRADLEAHKIDVNEKISKLERNQESLAAETRRQSDFLIRLDGHIQTVNEGIASIRRDIRDLRNEHARDTDP